MDKQSELELSHRLEVRRIVLDKAFFGLLLVGGALLANFTIERYKSEEITHRFLLEKRVEGARQILRSHSNTTGPLYQMLEARCAAHEASPGIEIIIVTSTEQFASAVNTHTFLFTSDFEDVAHRTMNLHRGLARAEGSVEQSCEYRNYLNALSEHFEYRVKTQLGLVAERRTGVAPLDISRSQLDSIGVDAYLLRNYGEWKKAAD